MRSTPIMTHYTNVCGVIMLHLLTNFIRTVYPATRIHTGFFVLSQVLSKMHDSVPTSASYTGSSSFQSPALQSKSRLVDTGKKRITSAGLAKLKGALYWHWYTIHASLTCLNHPFDTFTWIYIVSSSEFSEQYPDELPPPDVRKDMLRQIQVCMPSVLFVQY
jgi:hypothetical protein